MHFDILVEDQSGKKALEILVPKIIGNDHTFKINSYKGIGRIPKGMNVDVDPAKRILLNNLPRLLRGYGKTYHAYPPDYQSTVIFISDLDQRCLKEYLENLTDILDHCNPKPNTKFCIAIEEGEAWLLGDIPAIKKAYPRARDSILNSYVNDSICGTWETLAEAIYSGGHHRLEQEGYSVIGKEKSDWATRICPHMNVDENMSPSFQYFRDKIKELAQ